MCEKPSFKFVARWFLFLSVGSLVFSPSLSMGVESFDSLRITEVVKSVEVRNAKGGNRHAARVNEVFDRQRLLETGADSRAELLAGDGTVTRLGAHTIFSYVEGKREVNLQKGTLLFHSPTGKGGGVIRSPGATAGVIGTSILVSATRDGGFKLLVLEGKAKATLPGGKSISLGAGQLTLVLPGTGASGGFGSVVNFRLRDQVAGAKLVTGFKTALASLPKIKEAVEVQEKKIAEGTLEATSMQVSSAMTLNASQAMSQRVEMPVPPVRKTGDAYTQPPIKRPDSYYFPDYLPKTP